MALATPKLEENLLQKGSCHGRVLAASIAVTAPLRLRRWDATFRAGKLELEFL